MLESRRFAMIVYRVLPQSLLFNENAIFRFPRFCHGGHIRCSMILRPSNALKHRRNGPIQYQRKKQKKKNSKPISKRKPELSDEETKSSQNEWNYNENNRYGNTVDCRVHVISWRERHITASIVINADEQSVWNVLTDYERLAEFIPNLVCSKRIPCPHPDRIWVMQRGVQSALYWHIEAQVVLDLLELPDMVNGKELHFAMVDGDFKQYEGKWSLRPGPRFVPNLAISKIISRESNKVRLLQEGCKGLLYMVLHARVVLDLWECPEHEIHFEQVEGDFDSFRGKWVFEQLGSQHTLLKYVVETKMQKNCLLAEAIVEEVIYEDLPSNLSAIRDRVEIKKNADMNHSTRSTYEKGLRAQNQYDAKDSNLPRRDETTKGLKIPGDIPTKQRPKVPGLQQDIEILKSELSMFIAEYGQEGFMPKRKHLRLHGRVDLEKAITRMGGFRNIASLMNLSLSYKDRKPKGYWDSIETLKQEVRQFQRMWGMDPSYMPSRKSFERAGRFDLARAFEKWGGLHEVSRLLMLNIRHQRRSDSDSVKHDREDFKSCCRTNFQTLKIPPFKAHTPRDLNKWLIMLDELDPNGVH